MLSPTEAFQRIYGKIKREWKLAFFTVLFLGLLIHMPILVSDIPNHDGLDSMYFDQNMITSGRWFLTVACGFSSYFTLPWLIGLLGLVFLGCAAAAICEILQVRKSWAVVLISGLLVAFPALSSTFAYVFTLDGYMLALLLAVLAVLFTGKYRLGFLPGAVCLAFSMGTYQAYLPFAMILSVFAILMLFGVGQPGSRREAAGRRREGTDGRKKAKSGEKNKILQALHYLYMGVIGALLYYVILQILLKIQGKELADYQGINGMVSGAGAGGGILSTVVGMYRDFVSFTFGGNVLWQNIFSCAACILLAVVAAAAVIFLAGKRKWWKNPLLFVIMILAVCFLPMITNVILLISPNVTYHLLMRYQWVLYLIGAVALAAGLEEREAALAKTGEGPEAEEATGRQEPGKQEPGKQESVRQEPGEQESGKQGPGEQESGKQESGKPEPGKSGGRVVGILQWGACLGAAVLIFCYGVTDNIAYSNLQKKYEKTYAYCVRLLDRIEQTPGYYQGIPIAMIGVVGEEQYPVTDVTGAVTSNMIGMSGDSLLYTGDNYRAFMEHFLGATLNILPAEAMAEMYYSEEYIAMDTFPGENSIRIIDGVMYIKTENTTR